METKHTEGTWKTGPCTEGIEVFVRGTAIARCPKSFSDEEFNKEVEANAKLIAAAPELLEALKEAYEHIDSYFFPELKEKCLKAINKATLTNLKMS